MGEMIRLTYKLLLLASFWFLKLKKTAAPMHGLAGVIILSSEYNYREGVSQLFFSGFVF